MQAGLPKIGYERYVARDWLDQTAQWVISGKSREELHELIDDYLASFIQGVTSKRKTKNVLFGAWVKVNAQDALFREEAKSLFLQANTQEKLAIHWGMLISGYPFFLSLSRILGRLFRLQESASKSEIMRRCVEEHGDRDSVRRAAERYLQSLLEWGVLSSNQQGLLQPTPVIPLYNQALVTWLLPAVFFSGDRERLSVDDLFADPVWFPFSLQTTDFLIPSSQTIEIVHQGVSETLLALKPKPKPPPTP